MQVPARALDEPIVHETRLVGDGVVEHYVDVEVGGHHGLDLIKEGAEFAPAAVALADADDRVRLHVEGGKQIRGAVALVVVAVALDLAGAHGKHRRGTLDSLDLRLLVDAQHERSIR